MIIDLLFKGGRAGIGEVLVKFNKYTIIARFYPTVIILIPLTISFMHIVSIIMDLLFSDSIIIKVTSNLTLSFFLIFFTSQVIRFFGKELFERYIFNDELYMPTTNVLLPWDYTFSDEFKNQIYKRIYDDFRVKINLDQNEEDLRFAIKDTVGLISSKVKDKKLIRLYNIEYGFVRNLIGGAPLALVFSLLNVYFYFDNLLVLCINIFFILFFFLLLSFCRDLMIRYANLYAKNLFHEYLTL